MKFCQFLFLIATILIAGCTGKKIKIEVPLSKYVELTEETYSSLPQRIDFKPIVIDFNDASGISHNAWRDGFVIKSYQHLDSLIEELNKDPYHKISKVRIPMIDFSQLTLIGAVCGHGCCEYLEPDSIRNEFEIDTVNSKVIFTTLLPRKRACIECPGAMRTTTFWYVIRKLPIGYSVEFKCGGVQIPRAEPKMESH